MKRSAAKGSVASETWRSAALGFSRIAAYGGSNAIIESAYRRRKGIRHSCPHGGVSAWRNCSAQLRRVAAWRGSIIGISSSSIKHQRHRGGAH